MIRGRGIGRSSGDIFDDERLGVFGAKWTAGACSSRDSALCGGAASLCGMGVWRRVYEVMMVAMGGKGTLRQYGVAVGGGRRWSKGQTKAVSADCRARWRKRQEKTTAQRAKDKDKR